MKTPTSKDLLGNTCRVERLRKAAPWIHSGSEDHLLIEEPWKRVD